MQEHWGPPLWTVNFQVPRHKEKGVARREGPEEERKGGDALGAKTRQGPAPNNPVSLLRKLQRAFTARLATHSNVESPSSRLRIPNSTRREPAPAVHVSLLLSGGTPVFRFTWGEEETKDLRQQWRNSRGQEAKSQRPHSTREPGSLQVSRPLPLALHPRQTRGRV